jgi:SAM-dependent methyltransferase
MGTAPATGEAANRRMPTAAATETAPRNALAAQRTGEREPRWSVAPRIATRRACRGADAPAPIAPLAPRARPRLVDGPPVDMVTIADPEALSPHDQLVADALIAELEAEARRAQRRALDRPSALANPERYPSMAQWLALRGTALALHPLHRPSSERLVHGFDFADFLVPRFDGASAVDVLRDMLGAERAGAIVDRHRAFCDAPMSDEARLVLAGSADARAIRQRSAITAHTIAALGWRWSRGVRVAAVGAGSGDAVCELAARLDARSLTLVDRDPMALAAAHVVCAERLPDAVVRPVLAARGAARTLGEQPGSGFDVIDLRGAVGTLTDAGVAALLLGARAALRPGGVIVTANMLDRRPQQTFLDHVLRWPAVVQRSPAQLHRAIAGAGFDARQVALAIPATAPVCAIATIDTAA